MRFSYRLVSLNVGGGPRVVRADLEPEPYLRADEVEGLMGTGLLDEPTGFEARIGDLKIRFAQWRIA